MNEKGGIKLKAQFYLLYKKTATQSTIFVKQFNIILNVIDTQSLKISGLKIV